MRAHNWLVSRIRDEAISRRLHKYASGILVDIGCGDKPYATTTEGLVTEHIGLDHIDTQHDRSNIDFFASAYNTALPAASADTLLCTAVLEHLERPEDALREMHHILKSGGYLILTVPLFWHLHEEPRDFYRYTKYGLRYLLTQTGFDIVEVASLSGFVVTFSQELCYFLQQFRRRPVGRLISGIQFVVQWLAYRSRSWDQSHQFTWLYLVVAQRR